MLGSHSPCWLDTTALSDLGKIGGNHRALEEKYNRNKDRENKHTVKPDFLASNHPAQKSFPHYTVFSKTIINVNFAPQAVQWCTF